MKITIAGSLGHISKPLTQELLLKGHSVTVISSKIERKEDIEALGATAAIGSVEDVHFLAASFKGADAVYSMLPPPNFSEPNFDLMTHAEKIAKNYEKALRQSGVRRVVHLSSIGPHTDKGNGMLLFHHNAERTLEKLPADVAITFMRPVGFFYNLLSFIPGIKAQGVIASNYGADDIIPWVSTVDIAAAVADEIGTPSVGRKVRYVASEELSCNEVASLLGNAIGKPDLKWIIIPDEQLLGVLKSSGMNANRAEGFIKMNAAMHSGKLFEDYDRNKPALGKVKLKDFAGDFAAALGS